MVCCDPSENLQFMPWVADHHGGATVRIQRLWGKETRQHGDSFSNRLETFLKMNLLAVLKPWESQFLI
jgi:hypothetical protein